MFENVEQNGDNAEDLRITVVDKHFWVGKKNFSINDLERGHGDLIRLEEGINRVV